MPDAALADHRQDRRLDIGLGNIEGAQLAPLARVAGEIGFCFGPALVPHLFQPLAVARKDRILGVDQGEQPRRRLACFTARGQSIKNPGPIGKTLGQTGFGQQL